MSDIDRIEEQLKKSGIVKLVTHDYIVYKREWFFDHLEMELELQKRAKKLYDSRREDYGQIKKGGI